MRLGTVRWKDCLATSLRWFAFAGVLQASVSACGDSEESAPPGTGGTATSAGRGGTNTGGAVGKTADGAAAASGSAGAGAGTSGSDGSGAAGAGAGAGGSSTDASAGSGGQSATGGSTGSSGQGATGGSAGSGGQSATGGSAGSGGQDATGGSAGRGGQGATGGSAGSGGTAGTSADGSAGSATGGTVGDSGAESSTGGTGADSGIPEGGTPDSSDAGDLQPPAPGTGVQIVTKDLVIPPDSEVFRCYRMLLPAAAEVKVQRFVSKLTPATQQWFTLYRSDSSPPIDGAWQNNGCTQGFGGQSWLYATGAPDYELALPGGVAKTLAAGQGLAFDTHYLNSTNQPTTIRIAINLHFATGATEEASALVAFHTGIHVPFPDGVQTVSGTCTPGAGAKFFSMTTHTHQYATQAVLGTQRGDGSAETFVQTADWRSPAELRRTTAPFVTFAPGERLSYSCSYLNPRLATLTVGTSFVSNEQCMAISYFFPASASGSCSGGI